MPTASQTSANMMSSSTPTSSSQSSGDAFGRKPISIAVPITRMSATNPWMMLPQTCPASTAPREIDIERKRATIPSCMSIETPMAVPPISPAIVTSRMPGTTNSR